MLTAPPRLADRRTVLTMAGALAVPLVLMPAAAWAASAQEITARGRAALNTLYASNPTASALGKRARAVLVFPSITKAGFIVGGQGGEGVLLVGGKPASFHRIAAASYGLQAGAQKFGYALFFITQSSLDELRTRDGWAIGSGPSLVVIDEGMAKSMNTTTLQKDVYAVAFNQRGLMAGLGLEGSKITEFKPKA